MTSPQEFYQNVMNILTYLDTILPAGSSVVCQGLLHGGDMWDVMSNQPYPYFGITYAELWAFLSDSWTDGPDNRTLNPCWGWLNPDPYWRNASTQHAAILSQVYQDMVKNTTWKHFDLYYMDHPDAEVVREWVKQGNNASDLFQPVGGGHPSQTAVALWADLIWKNIEQNFPQILGPVNPYNDEIEAMFGDQGGY